MTVAWYNLVVHMYMYNNKAQTAESGARDETRDERDPGYHSVWQSSAPGSGLGARHTAPLHRTAPPMAIRSHAGLY